MQGALHLRNVFEGVEVGVELVVEAALEAAALAGQLLGIEAEVLVAGSRGAHGFEVLQPRRAAQLAPAHADAADAAGLLAQGNLTHLDAHAELVGEAANELAEVDPVFGRVVEQGAGAVGLVLHVAELHAQAQLAHHSAGPEHGTGFEVAHGYPALLVVGGGDAQDGANFLRVGGDFLLAHLQAHQLALERDVAEVPARAGRFHHHGVARHERQALFVAHELLPAALEAHLHHIEPGKGVGYLHVLEPVEHVHAVAAAGATASFRAAAPYFGGAAAATR